MKKTILSLAIIGVVSLAFTGCEQHQLVHYPSHKVYTQSVLIRDLAPVQRVYVYDSPVYIDSYSYHPTKYKNLYKQQHTITPHYGHYYEYELMHSEPHYIIKP